MGSIFSYNNNSIISILESVNSGKNFSLFEVKFFTRFLDLSYVFSTWCFDVDRPSFVLCFAFHGRNHGGFLNGTNLSFNYVKKVVQSQNISTSKVSTNDVVSSQSTSSWSFTNTK